MCCQPSFFCFCSSSTAAEPDSVRPVSYSLLIYHNVNCLSAVLYCCSSLSDSVCGSARSVLCLRIEEGGQPPPLLSPVLCASSARAGLFTSSNAPILPVLAARRGVQARPSCNKQSEESAKTQVSSDTPLSHRRFPSLLLGWKVGLRDSI